MSIGKAKATPTKDFFVSMLTRDISLEDCILDLIDNAVDAAWKAAGQKPTTLVLDSALREFRISIEMSSDGFRISDNCTGISLDDAVNYAFTFGRVEGDEPDEYSVGVYGIGMKRAVFKLGAEITIQSTYKESNGALTGFSVPINVPEWLRQTSASWDFDIDDMAAEPHVGVTVSVSQLLPDTSELLGDATYERALRRILARDYMVPLMRGLVLSVNDVEVRATPIELRQNESFAPMRSRYQDGEVQIEIVAGMVFNPPDDTDPDDRKDEVSGWYVVCNGRMILAADRSRLTLWGEQAPMWHRQYAGFVGLVFFSSEHPLLLPMTTTKRSVDASSAVYRRALAQMYLPTRQWIDYTNARKLDLKSYKELEGAAAASDLVSVADRETIALPSLGRKVPAEPVANVNYAVPRKRLQALAAALGNKRMTHRDVGLKSFEYAFDQLVEEE